MTDTGPIPPSPTPPPSGSTPPAGAPLDHGKPAGVPVYTGPEPDKDSRTMAMLAHLLGILGFIGPLIIWLIKKDQSPFVDDQGKEAINFHLVMLIGYVVGGLTFCIFIGMIIVPAVWIVSVIFSILGAIKANQGIAYRYPFNIRFIK